ncbi:MAG: glutaminase A [Microbacterium sp.]
MDADTPVNPVDHTLGRILAAVAAEDHPGEVADYIPELRHADPGLFGVGAVSVMGRRYGAGDTAARFTLQSISKPFVYALALAELGVDVVLDHVGVEPSGAAFNAISFDDAGRPLNPMINAGALVTTALIPGESGAERFERIRQGLSAFAGRRLQPNDAVYRSESETGDRNRALATLARASGVLASGVDDAAEPYFRQCSIEVDCGDIAIMGATLANNGVNPLTGVEVIDARTARRTLSVMASCGMYDRSGEWLFRVGMPAKSGVGGGIVAVVPGEFGIGVFSPPLDPAGNSSRGAALLRTLSREFGLHTFGHPTDPLSPIEAVIVDEAGTVTFDVRGELDFAAVEQVSSAVRERLSAEGSARIVVDLASVTWVSIAAGQLLEALIVTAREAGRDVTTIDPQQRISLAPLAASAE